MAAIKEAELVIGDFRDRQSVAHALQGVDHAFLLTNSSEYAEEQQTAFVDIAHRSGVKHIVKLSQWAASPAGRDYAQAFS